MTEPSVEEYVLEFERSNYWTLRATIALIASWRERGEALRHARGTIEAIMSDGNCDCQKDFAIIDAALKDKP